MQTMVNDPSTYPIFTSNDDNATYRYSGIEPDLSPIFYVRPWTYILIKPNQFFLDVMNANAVNDPRIPIWFVPTPATDGTANPIWLGLPHGASVQTLIQVDEPDMSFKTELHHQTTSPFRYMVFAETQFILAEAAQRGWITIGTAAQDLYETGINASMEQWGADPTGYVSQPGVVFDNNNDINKILTQKWIALYYSTGGFDGWNQYRRTGFPNFPTGDGNVNGGLIANRFIYPNAEQTLNAESYQEALSRIGGTDDINAKLWWQN